MGFEFLAKRRTKGHTSPTAGSMIPGHHREICLASLFITVLKVEGTPLKSNTESDDTGPNNLAGIYRNRSRRGGSISKLSIPEIPRTQNQPFGDINRKDNDQAILLKEDNG